MRLPAALMFLSALLLGQQLSPGEALRIAAFNLHRLSPGKLNPLNANNIKGPLSQFICKQKWDIAFLQELTCEDALNDLVNALNQNPNCKFENIQYHSIRTGRLPVQGVYNREIIAYIYRADKVTVLDSAIRQLTYPVGSTPPTPAPIFFRPPFILRAQVTQAVPELHCMTEFFLIGLHARPARVYSELNGLVDAYDLTRHDYGQENALILGDFNADGTFFGDVDRLQNVLVTRQDFRWLIGDNTKTNTLRDKAYDRIVAAGQLMTQNVQNAQVPRWDSPLALSDHYPVSVDLRCPPPPHTMIHESSLDVDAQPKRRQNPSQDLRRFRVKNEDVVGQ